MRKLLLFCLSWVVIAAAFGQIKITKNEMPYVPGKKATYRVADKSVLQADIPAPGDNKTYDFSKIKLLDRTVSGDSLITPPSHPDFTDATVAVRFDFPFLPIIRQKGYFMYRLDDTGIYQLGNLFEKTSGNISQTDSMVIPAGVGKYSDPKGMRRVMLPLEKGAKSNQTAEFRSNAKLYIKALGLDGAAVTLVEKIEQRDSVVGWGNVILPNGRSVEVLHVASASTTTRNYLLNGAPAPDVLLAQFGLTNGDQFVNGSHAFYAKGYFEPVVEWFIDPQADTVRSVWFDAPSLVSRHDDAAQAVGATVFPNPSDGNQIQVVLLEANRQAMNLQIVNTLGQTVHQLTIPQGTEVMTFDLPQNIPSGIYFLQAAGTNIQRLVLNR